IHYQDMIRYIEEELPIALTQSSLPNSISGRVSRRLKYFPIKPEVLIRGDENGLNYYLQITCADRPGLLYAIAQTLAEYRIDIHNAKINTMGERVEDTLLVSGDALRSSREALRLQSELVEKLSVPRTKIKSATQ
ncbi:MAG: ACT domain-containing protein, partial [Proteobacteria bacterium]|nr:ACT domain-containing protein [Pseudomonadota bacterium]